MNLHSFPDSPFVMKLSFEALIDNLRQQEADPKNENAPKASLLLREVALHPELVEGITEPSQIEQNADLLSRLLAEMFPASLTHNEIKAVSIPYLKIIFNHTERFKSILQAAGPDFEINIRDFDEHQFYVLNCCLILNEYYGTELDFTKPLFYDIPAANGINKHFRILYNADYLEILPTEKSVKLTEEDIDLLINNYDNLALWKEKFPRESWVLKGFAIMTLFDATIENAVSIFKEKLLGLKAAGFKQTVESIFQSIFRIPDIKIGFILFNQTDGKFSKDAFGQQLPSYIIPDDQDMVDKEIFCYQSYKNLIEDKEYFTVSDTDDYLTAYPDSSLVHHIAGQKFRSFILAPIVKNQVLLGVLEVLSFRPKELNSINANKLEVVLPFLTNTLERLLAQLQNEVQAVIQEKYTTIHPSVYWKFRAEAFKLIHNQQLGKPYELTSIVFPDVYPMYGQVDIKGSSEARNLSLQKDLQTQLDALTEVLEIANRQNGQVIFQTEIQQLHNFREDLSRPIKASTEQQINSYTYRCVHRQLKQLTQPNLVPIVTNYLSQTDKSTGSFHANRRKYISTISLINEKLASIIDQRQTEAQALFPHYYERFKTDGVEHNLYIGASISPRLDFNLQKLHALRLWQLQVLCEMEKAHHELRPLLPIPLEVTTLILAYNTSINICFRMDEKRFDVDGSYNARFEIIKKRIDKAHVHGTNERITEPGKITIVYSDDAEEQEYTRYVNLLQDQNVLDNFIEKLEVEDLQGISGLKALRIKINHNNN